MDFYGRDNRDPGEGSNPIAKIRSIDKFFKPFEEIGQANRSESLPCWSEPGFFCYAHSKALCHLGRTFPMNRNSLGDLTAFLHRRSEVRPGEGNSGWLG